MTDQKYTAQQVAEGAFFYNTLKSVPEDKQGIVALMAEAFINGMNAQERLVAKMRQEA
ncbi:MAG: hypothetical protein K2M42_05900 [Oscillospiraceae bacterium]|nr:hypothetical protein [Oscillospiraceae bacterium]